MSSEAAYVYHVHRATGLDEQHILYRLPYARGLQYLAMSLAALGHKFLGPPLSEEETFSYIAADG